MVQGVDNSYHSHYVRMFSDMKCSRYATTSLFYPLKMKVSTAKHLKNVLLGKFCNDRRIIVATG